MFWIRVCTLIWIPLVNLSCSQIKRQMHQITVTSLWNTGETGDIYTVTDIYTITIHPIHKTLNSKKTFSFCIWVNWKGVNDPRFWYLWNFNFFHRFCLVLFKNLIVTVFCCHSIENIAEKSCQSISKHCYYLCYTSLCDGFV